MAALPTRLAQVRWFRERVGATGTRVRKVMVVALARKLLIALWRFVTHGVVPKAQHEAGRLIGSRIWPEAAPAEPGHTIQGGVAVVRHGA